MRGLGLTHDRHPRHVRVPCGTAGVRARWTRGERAPLLLRMVLARGAGVDRVAARVRALGGARLRRKKKKKGTKGNYSIKLV